MRRSLVILALALALVPAQSHAKVRVGWLVTAIASTAATAGFGVGSVGMHGLSALERDIAETNSSATPSTYYNTRRGERYYNSYGTLSLDLADSYRTIGWVYAGAAVIAGVVAIVAWPQIKTRPAPAGPEALLDLSAGQVALAVPDLDYHPDTQAYRVDLLRAHF